MVSEMNRIIYLPQIKVQKHIQLIVFFTLFSSLFCLSQNSDTLNLKDTQEFPEIDIKVNNPNKKYHILGTYDSKTRLLGLRNGFKNECKSNEVAVFIPKNNEKSIIKYILVHVNGLNKDSLYTLVLYTAKLNGVKPYPNTVIFSYKLSGKLFKKGGNKIDISALKIPIPQNGIFVGFRGNDFSFNATDEHNTIYTVIRIRCGEMKNRWVWTTGSKDGTIENARFGLLMEN